MRLIWVPQYPAKLRYQEWWYDEFPKQLAPYFDEVLTIDGALNACEALWPAEHFAPLMAATHWELNQVERYMELELRDDDCLLCADISFPGYFPTALTHKRPKGKTVVICHATSRNTLDYFANVRGAKWLMECGAARLFDTVLVASPYHYSKLMWDNAKINALPYPPFRVEPELKMYDVISVARDGVQKRTIEYENYVEGQLGVTIARKHCKSWEEYYRFISSAKVMLITAKEETFGYQVVDAVLNNCIPVAPMAYSYTSMLHAKYLYMSPNEMVDLVRKYLKGYHEAPRLLKEEESKNFYKNLARELKGI